MPTPERQEIRKLLEEVNNLVNSDRTAIDQIYSEELVRANLSKVALAIASTARDASKCKILLCREYDNFLDYGLNRVRRQVTPILPASMRFDISLLYQQAIDKDRYFLADRVQCANGTVVKRMIIFSIDEQLHLLFSSSHIMMDGTFD